MTRIPARARYDRMNESEKPEAGVMKSWIKNAMHSSDSISRLSMPSTAMTPSRYISAARFRLGKGPTIKQYSMIITAPAIAATFNPSGFFRRKEMRETRMARCIPERASIYEQPASRYWAAKPVSRLSRMPKSRASARPPHAPV